MLPLIEVTPNYYENEIPLAKKYVGHRDMDDIHLAALALKDKIPVWSNDRDFADLPLDVFPTSKLLRILNL